MKRAYSYFRHTSAYVVPLSVAMTGNGPWPSMATEIAMDAAKRKSVPVIIQRCNPQKPLTGDDVGRVWPLDELAAAYYAFGQELHRRGLQFTLIDDAEYDRTAPDSAQQDERYYLGCVEPILRSYPKLKWANFGTMPGSLIGDLQTACNPVLYLYPEWWKPNPPTTGAGLVDVRMQQLRQCLATGKPVYPYVGSLAVAADYVTPEEWRGHFKQVALEMELARNPGQILIFDETRGTRGDEGKECRTFAADIVRTGRKAG